MWLGVFAEGLLDFVLQVTRINAAGELLLNNDFTAHPPNDDQLPGSQDHIISPLKRTREDS